MADEKNIVVEGVHSFSREELYEAPGSPVKEKLEEFKDMKLGFMIHWGIYAQLGTVASWGLVDQDASWARERTEYGHRADWEADGNKLREEYFGLINSFNPLRFEPDEWAELAADTGFKYLIFTTKHHDGFCMWDTKQTDFKVTSPDCPFSKHEKSDILKHVFDAFRKKNMAIGAYFSKPDWHNEDYWESDVCKKISTTRHPTYDVTKNPEKWQKFTDFAHNQLTELVDEYGKIDILWLDGGWICDEQDINLDEAVEKVRKINPELIVVDRSGGKHENYITPEQTIPGKCMNVPWESCLTLGKNFNYIFDDDYKSPSELINLLLEIVCKGGNLALNVSPQPDGRMPRNAIKSLKGMGDWLKKYGEAIYKTRTCYPYKENDIFFTQTPECVYAIAKNFNPEFIPCTEKIRKIEFLNNNTEVEFTQQNGGIALNFNCGNVDEEFRVFKLVKV